MQNLVKFIDNLNAGDVISAKDVEVLKNIQDALKCIKIENKDRMAKIEFPAKYLKEVYNYLITLK